jgi:phospholipase D1/2
MGFFFPATYIPQAEQQSGVKYHEAQIALARQWVGTDGDGSQTEVTIALPVETKEGLVVSDKTAAKTETIKIPESVDAARQVVERFEAGAKHVRGDEDVADNVAQHMLTDRTGLLDEKWLGTEEEELNA